MIESLHKQFAAKGLKVIGVSVDDCDTIGDVKPFIQQFGMTYFVSVSPNANQHTADAFQVQGLPAEFLIDKKGIVRWSHSNYSPDEKAPLTAMIKKLLAERP